MLFFPLMLLSLKNEEDRAYIDLLYRQHCRLMFAAAWKYTSDRETAEDIVSESIVSLIGRVPVLRAMDEPALRGYLLATVRNTAYNHFKKTQRRDAHHLHVSDEAIARLPGKDSPDDHVLLEEALAAVLHAMHGMTEREQAVLKMKYFYGMENEDIARVLSLAPESIRQVLSRARKRLKEIVNAKEASES